MYGRISWPRSRKSLNKMIKANSVFPTATEALKHNG